MTLTEEDRKMVAIAMTFFGEGFWSSKDVPETPSSEEAGDFLAALKLARPSWGSQERRLKRLRPNKAMYGELLTKLAMIKKGKANETA